LGKLAKFRICVNVEQKLIKSNHLYFKKPMKNEPIAFKHRVGAFILGLIVVIFNLFVFHVGWMLLISALILMVQIHYMITGIVIKVMPFDSFKAVFLLLLCLMLIPHGVLIVRNYDIFPIETTRDYVAYGFLTIAITVALSLLRIVMTRRQQIRS